MPAWQSGAVLVRGEDPIQGRRLIGYVPQRKSFDRDFPATPLEVVVANLRGRWPMRITEDERALAMDALKRTGAGKLASRLSAQADSSSTKSPW